MSPFSSPHLNCLFPKLKTHTDWTSSSLLFCLFGGFKVNFGVVLFITIIIFIYLDADGIVVNGVVAMINISRFRHEKGGKRKSRENKTFIQHHPRDEEAESMLPVQGGGR